MITTDDNLNRTDDYIKELEYKILRRDEALDRLKGLVCDPDGYICVNWSDGDKAELQKVLTLLEI